VTEEGKERSSRNALRHGGLAVVHTAPGESADAYDDAERDLVAALRPRNPVEVDLVHTIAVDLVRSRRVTAYMEAAEELHVDDLEAEDADLHEELHRLQTLRAQWIRLLPKMETFEHLQPREIAEYLQKVGDVMEGGDSKDDPSDAYSTYYTLLNLRALQEGFRSGVTSQRLRWKEPLKGYMTQEFDKLNKCIEVLESRIQRRAELQERMARSIPDEKTLKLVSRYQATIDNALARRLGVIKELRSLGDKGSSAGAE